MLTISEALSGVDIILLALVCMGLVVRVDRLEKQVRELRAKGGGK